jgi:soluble lytic murein transglycosylase-like protein
VASTTVIDTLIVKLGLDPKGFTDGQKKAAAEGVKFRNETKKNTDEMGRDWTGFIGKVAGIATAAVAVKKFLSYTSDLSAGIRQLGIDSDNFKMAASELRNFGNIAEMNGGKAEDATKSVSGLTKAVYDLAYNGSMSDSLIMLGRLGVQFQDTTGNMRDFKSIVLDTQASIQGAMRNGTSRANAYQMLMQAGFDPGLANAMLKGDVQSQLARQEQRRQVSGSDVTLATKWEQSAANRSQALDAAALKQLAVEAVPGTMANNAIAATADAAGNATIGGTTAALAEAFTGATTAVKGFVDTLHDSINEAHLRSYPRGVAAYQSQFDKASKKYGLPDGMLAGIAKTESNFNPMAKNASGATGMMQLMPQYFPGAGQNPFADINTSAEYVRKLHDAHVSNGDADDQGAWALALESYNAGQSRVRRSLAGGKPLAQETIDYPGKVLGYAAQATPSPGVQGTGGNSHRTDITFENVNINTNAKNGEGIATDFVDASRRKLQAAQAETGMQ